MIETIWHGIDTLLEIGILFVLIKEYNYDKIQYEKGVYKQRRVKSEKTKEPHDKIPVGDPSNLESQ